MKTDENTLEIKAIEGGSIRCSLLNDFKGRSAFGAIRAGTAFKFTVFVFMLLVLFACRQSFSFYNRQFCVNAVHNNNK